jgi:hypothetical protein
MDEEAKNEFYKKFMEQTLQQFEEVSSEEYHAPEEINLDDYVFADTDEQTADHEFKNDINILNILMCYYKDAYNITDNLSMFDGIKADDESATNKCMEFVYGEIFLYDKSEIADKNVLFGPNDEIDMDKCKQLYCLMIDNEPKFVCQFTLPLASYLSSIDWLNTDWCIIDLV